MPETNLPKPTDAELSILRILWDRGPSTVREVHDIASRERPIAYTTTLKLLQIMTDKGLAVRTEEGRSHIYAPSLGEQATQRRLIDDLVERAFGGSAAKLVMRALDTEPASHEERLEILRLIRERSEENERD